MWKDIKEERAKIAETVAKKETALDKEWHAANQKLEDKFNKKKEKLDKATEPRKKLMKHLDAEAISVLQKMDEIEEGSGGRLQMEAFQESLERITKSNQQE